MLTDQLPSIDLTPYVRNVWITSDHHFGHANVVAPASRPFSPAAQDAEMARRWRDTVQEMDPVLHLGDLVVGPFSEDVWQLVRTLPGHPKWLVRGNHHRPHRLPLIEAAGFTVVAPPVLVHDDWLAISPTSRWDASELSTQTLNVHGHVHSRVDMANDPRHINVSVEVTDYRPVRLVSLIERRITRLGNKGGE